VAPPTFAQTDRDFVYRVACKIVDPESAEDVAQDAMLLAYRHREAYRGDARYHTWLYRIAATAAFGHLRRRRQGPGVSRDDDALDRAIDPARSPEALLGDYQQAARALAILEQLAPMYRDVVLLRMSLSEAATAARLGITVANVKVRAHRARRMLQSAANDQVNDQVSDQVNDQVSDQVSACATPG
jgi:RNA polymerase sigma-70 factor (ECF subfamily)